MEKKTWKEFTDSRLLWWVNRSLHLFGWAIVIEEDDDGNVLGAYPARVTYRGFSKAVEESGFAELTQHLADNIGDLWAETKM